MTALTAMSRTEVLASARQLGERIDKGCCPHADVIKQANDAFVARLGKHNSDDMSAVIASTRRQRTLLNATSFVSGLAGFAGIGAAAWYALKLSLLNPTAASAGLAAAAGLAVVGLWRISGAASRRADRLEDFERLAQRWTSGAQQPLPDAPEVPLESQSAADLSAMVQRMDEKMKGSVYEAEIADASAALVHSLSYSQKDPVQQRSQALRGDNDRFRSFHRELETTRWVSRGLWTASLAVTAAIDPGIGLCVGGLALISSMCRGIMRDDAGVVATTRAATSQINSWMAATTKAWQQKALLSPTAALFGTPVAPPRPDLTIEQANGALRIAGIPVPIRA